MEMNFTDDEYIRYALEPNDILLNEGQSLELVGRPAIYRGEIPGACFTNTLVRFRASPGVVPEYALAVFLTYLKNGRFRKIAKITTNIAHLGAGRFADLEFPLPPVDEQHAIAALIEERVSALDACAAEIDRNICRASLLRHAILKRAFDGHLVPQDPSDEPASVLLERIRQQREAQTIGTDPNVKWPGRKSPSIRQPRRKTGSDDTVYRQLEFQTDTSPERKRK